MRWLSALMLVAVVTVGQAEMYAPPLDFDASDSFFLPGESHAETEVRDDGDATHQP
jgi:hypothetical protein